MRQSDLSFYAQDNYKVSNRLTLNLGVHYENFLGWPWTEVNNKEYDFVPSISTTALEQVGTNGIPRSGLSGNNLNFAPRVGAAYKVTNKTVFHAGYGIYYAAPDVGNSAALSANVPVDNYWAFNNSATYGAAANGTPFNYAANGYVHTDCHIWQCVATQHARLCRGSKCQNSLHRAVACGYRAADSLLDRPQVCLCRNQGHPPGQFAGHQHEPVGSEWSDHCYSESSLRKSSRNQYLFFAQISELETRQVSSYNALQVTAERRAHGLSFLASYTYSHALDEGSGESATVTNPYNLRYDYGNADYNVPNRFVASANYQLPFKGSGLLGPLERGWQVNAIAQFFDGLPFSVASGTALGDGLTPRAQLLPGFGNGSLPKGTAHAREVVQHRGLRGPRTRGRGETPVAIFCKVRVQRRWTSRSSRILT